MTLTGESGIVTSDELELGGRLWLRLEDGETTEELVIEMLDESREWPYRG